MSASLPARFFFHASDGRVYGPADFPTLTRWRSDKRLHDDSRLREEKTGKFLTYAELAANPPLVEAAPVPLALVPASDTPPVEPEPGIAPKTPAVGTDADAEGPVFSLPELIRRGLDLYRRGFRLLWPVAAVIQAPLFALQYFFPQHYDPVTNLPTWSNHKLLLLTFAAMLVAALFSELGGGLLTNLIRQIEEDEPLSLGGAVGGLRGRIVPLCKTWLLRMLIIASWGFLAILIYSVLSQFGVPAPLRKVIVMVSLFPALLLFLRYLISTQVVLLEKLEGLQALRRSGDLVRFSNTGGTFISGDLRLLLLVLIPWLGIGLFSALLQMLAGAFSTKAMAFVSPVLSFLGAATATPFLVILFVLFVIDARRRLRQSGYDRS